MIFSDTVSNLTNISIEDVSQAGIADGQ